MKVKDLIKKLETMDQNKAVAYCDAEHGWVELSVEEVFEMEGIALWDSSMRDLKSNASVVAIG